MLSTRASGEAAVKGDLKAWIIPQIPGRPFEVDVKTIAEGKAVIRHLADFQLFMLKEYVMPDYSNVTGIMRYEDSGDGTFAWWDVDEEEEDDIPVVRIRFDDGPGPIPGRFVEVEDDRNGASISWGEWREDQKVPGHWFLYAPQG